MMYSKDFGPRIDAETFRRLCRAREFMDDCYNLSLDLDTISSQACFSRYHFLRLFKQAFNKTPHQYLTEKRIEKAKALLKSEDHSVTDICYEVGFESPGSFSTLFHKQVGHPPIIYRARSFFFRRPPLTRIPGCFLMMYGVEAPPARKF
jgi:AraC-like DNA-binding protein